MNLRALTRPTDLWAAYWFAPGSLFTLAFTRVVIVGFQIFWLLITGFAQHLYTLSQMSDFLYAPLPVLQVMIAPLGTHWRPPHDVMMVVFWATILVGITSVLGLRTNFSLLLFALGNLFMQAYVYSFNEFHHPDAVLIIALFALALGPSGAVFSLDDLWRQQREAASRQQFRRINILERTSPYARWPLLLMQWLFVLVYLSAAISKLTGGHGGLEWANGYTLRTYMLMDGLRWDSGLGLWLSQYQLMAIVFSWLTLIFEATIILPVIFPMLRWLYLPFGLAFHTSIYLIQRAPFFQWCATYAVFVPWDKAVTLPIFRRSAQARPEIFFDGGCSLCIRTMTLLSYFDWNQRLVFTELEEGAPRVQAQHPHITLEAMRREMHVVLPDGTVKKGFFAFREISRHLPAFWPLLGLLHLPLASTIGPKVYRFVARHRPQPADCVTGACAIHGAYR